MLTSRNVIRFLLIAVVIALAPVALSRLNPRPAPTPAPAPAPTAAPTATQVDEPAILGMAVPPVTAGRLRGIELGVAQNDGDPRPASIMAVTTTMTQALRLARPASPVHGPAAIVYLVLMKGSFGYDGVDTFGTHVTSGHYAWAIFEPVSLTPLATSITGHAPATPLSHLGPVSNLLRAP